MSFPPKENFLDETLTSVCVWSIYKGFHLPQTQVITICSNTVNCIKMMAVWALDLNHPLPQPLHCMTPSGGALRCDLSGPIHFYQWWCWQVFCLNSWYESCASLHDHSTSFGLHWLWNRMPQDSINFIKLCDANPASDLQTVFIHEAVTFAELLCG